MYTNGYIFRYAAIMVIIAAAVLSTAAVVLKPFQERNVAIEKMGGILTSANIEGVETSNTIEMFNKYVVEEIVVDKEGNVVESFKDGAKEDGKAFKINMKTELYKKKKGESFEQSLIREAKEEIGIVPTEYINMGELVFYNGEKVGFFVKVYLITEWKGTPKESDEVEPIWFTIDQIPYAQMWEDDKYWFPKVLEGKKIRAEFWFENLFGDRPIMIRHKIHEV